MNGKFHNNLCIFGAVAIIISIATIQPICISENASIKNDEFKNQNNFNSNIDEISSSRVLQVKQEIQNLINLTKTDELSVSEFILEIIEIFKKYEILPQDYSVEDIYDLMQSKYLREKLKIKNDYSFSSKFFSELKNDLSTNSINDFYKSNIPNNDPPFHIGFPTLKISAAVGGSYGNTITLPFLPIRDIFVYDNITVPNAINGEDGSIIFYGAYNVNPILYIPGSPTSYHGLISIFTFPGGAEYREAYWSGSTLVGMGIGEFTPLGIVCIFPGEIGSVTLFDIGLSVTVLDICIKFPPDMT